MRPDGSPSAVADAADTISHGASLTAAARSELTVAASRPAWTGRAADRFQDGVARMEGSFTTLIDASTSAAAALRAYAAELTRLQRTADTLADQFAGYGIAIDPVGRAVPTPGLHDPVTLDDNLRRHGPLFEDQARTLRREADQAAADAIRAVDTARSLLHARDGGLEALRRQFTDMPNAIGVGVSAYTAAAATYEKAVELLNELDVKLSAMEKDALRKTSPARRLKLMLRYQAEAARTAGFREALDETAELSGRFARHSPGAGSMKLDLGTLAKNEHMPGVLRGVASSKALRSVPLVGVGLTGWQVSLEVGHGESPTKSITSNVGSLIAGSVAADFAVTGALALGLAGGLPIVAGLAAGTLVAVGVGMAVNAFFETDLGHDVAQTVDHAVGEAADAVGDAISGAWGKIFG